MDTNNSEQEKIDAFAREMGEYLRRLINPNAAAYDADLLLAVPKQEKASPGSEKEAQNGCAE